MGGAGFLLIILAFVFLYFVLVRPQKRRQLQQQQMLDRIDVGDEIVTAGGLMGEIREVRDEEVLVRIAPDLDVRVARRAIAGVTPREEEEETEEPEEEHEELEHEELEPTAKPEESEPTPGTSSPGT